MAKIFYIAMVDADTTQAFFFNNKKKAQEKGMELYDGFGEFSFDLRGEEFEGDYVTTYIYSGIENVKEGFLFYREDGRPHFEAGSEADARAAVRTSCHVALGPSSKAEQSETTVPGTKGVAVHEDSTELTLKKSNTISSLEN